MEIFADILICEKNDFLAEKMTELLSRQENVRSVCLIKEIRYVSSLQVQRFPRILMIDIRVASENRLFLEKIKHQHPECAFLFYSDEISGMYRTRAFNMGAAGIISKADIEMHIGEFIKDISINEDVETPHQSHASSSVI